MPISPPAHTRRKSTTDSWITHMWLIRELGGFEGRIGFDLDPCACEQQPWQTARRMIAPPEDGLTAKWEGLVWLNPPYGKQTGKWLERLAEHGDGIALVFARTETLAFHDHVWPKADSLLFLRGRLNFCTPDGNASQKSHNSGGPSVLIGYGRQANKRLRSAQHLGALVRLS